MKFSLFKPHLTSACLFGASALAVPSYANVPRSTSCNSNTHPGPPNPSFETGTLSGWEVISGDAFGNASVTDTTSYWGGPFGQVGKYYVWGFAQSGDAGVGQMKSSSFRASSVMSLLVGGGYDPENLYVCLLYTSPSPRDS